MLKHRLMMNIPGNISGSQDNAFRNAFNRQCRQSEQYSEEKIGRCGEGQASQVAAQEEEPNSTVNSNSRSNMSLGKKTEGSARPTQVLHSQASGV